MTCVRRQSVRAGAAARRGIGGFTLIEVLMAAFVMAIGVLGLTALFAGAARQQQMSSQSTRSVAHARSAEAFISKRFGPIENMGGNPIIEVGDALPRNGQGTNESIIQSDQWYALPRNLQDGSISVNPEESTKGWDDNSLYTRSEPREVLPRLMYRTRAEYRENQVIPTGLGGGDPINKTGLGSLTDSKLGAPTFDDSMRELRVIADSVKLRVVTRAFPCTGKGDERSLITPDDRQIVVAWDGASGGGGGTTQEIRLIGEDGTEMLLVSKRDAKDADLGSSNGQTQVTFAHIAQVVDDVLGDPGCGASQLYWVDFDPLNPELCDAGGATEYVWPVSSGGDVDLVASEAGQPGYVFANNTIDGQRYMYARLKLADDCHYGAQMYTRVASGPYVINSDGVTPPANASTTAPVATVRTVQIPQRFIHEIWLDDYRYRAHTLVSFPESVTYSQPTPGEAGQRVPQLGYSMVFRRTADSTVQYALFSYAISPTYPPTADKMDRTDDDFFPLEDKRTIEQNRLAPLRLVKGMAIEFDEDLGQYYVLVKSAAPNTDEIPGWVATPGTVLLFNGDASATPPIPGADAPVRIVNTRRAPDMPSWVRAYLDGPPRAGLRALPDFDEGKTFDAWVVSAKCSVTQRRPGSMSYSWGLKPVEARIFTVGQ